MIIRRVEVRNFRKLVGPIVVEDLRAGLTILVGDNEEGKSTLLQAIRTCFFDKHNMTGERAQNLQPYNSAVRPEVRVEFELNGCNYSLFKAFCLRPEAELVTPSGRFADGAAEEQLAKLLRFTPPQRARRDASDHEHEGIFGMFWVEQGKSFQGINPTPDGRISIQHALQHEVGDVLGGKRGQRLLAEVARRRSEFLTPTGKPRGDYAQAVQQLSKLEGELRDVQSAFTEYERGLEELQHCRTRQNRYLVAHTVEQARDRLTKAREAAEQIAALQRNVDHADGLLSQVSVERDLAVDRAERRGELVRDVEASRNDLGHLKCSWDANHGLLLEIRERLVREEHRLAEAVAHFQEVEAIYIVARAAEQLARVKVELDIAVRQEHDAIESKTRSEKARELVTAIHIERKDVATLKRLYDALARAQAQLDALATHVRVDLSRGVKARIGSTDVVSGSEQRLTDTAVIDVLDCAKVTVIPGGDVLNPRAELQRAQESVHTALRELGVSDLASAESLFERRQELVSEIGKYQDIVNAFAPDGLDVLQSRVADLRGEARRLMGQAGDPKSVSETTSALRDAQSQREIAEKVRKTADTLCNQIRQELLSAQEAEATSKAGYDAETRRAIELERRLAKDRKQTVDEALERSLVIAAQKVTAAERTAAAKRQALEHANPESAELELTAAEAASQQLEKDVRQLSDRAIRLESELRAAGAQGLGERLQQLAAALNECRTLAKRFEHQARAADLLYRILMDAEKTAKETFLRPVADCLRPYLRLLLPDTELRLSEDIEIIGLRRGDLEEEFRDLSLGTREQLAVLTRLAFADLLRQNGQPAAVLLDDAIVFADDDRFKRMLHILRKASEKTQVIVFTCRERDYQNSGAPIVRLTECRQTSCASAAA